MASTLQDKVAIVTGASSGIGEAIAIMFASRGAKVTLCGRDESRLKSACDKAAKANGGHQDRLLMVKGDLTLSSVRQEILTKTVDKFGRLDILVPNAAVVPSNNGFSATEEIYDLTMNTNVKSTFFLIQQAAPYLEKTKGSIIVISSVVATILFPPNVIYPMSKAAIDHMVECLVVDLGPKGIRINTIKPPVIPTRVWREFPDPVLKKLFADESALQPLENRLGTADDIAEAVTFLASDASRFITGQNIRVDGGRSFFGPIATSFK